MNVSEIAYHALISSADIVSKLSGGISGIYKNTSKDAGSYPVIVYKTISVVPHQWAENKLSARRSTVRITILTNDGAYDTLSNLVYTVMTAAGFVWQSDSEAQDDQKKYKIMQFVFAEEVI